MNKRIIFFSFLAAEVIILFYYLKLNPYLENSVPISSLTTASSVENTKKPLQQIVEKSLEGSSGTYGIVIKNLKTGEDYYFNEHKVFEPGSLYKIWVMATVFQKIQSGGLKEDEILSEEVSVLNDQFNIASDSAELTEGTITLSVSDALKQMITISHNYAALLLTKRIKLLSIATFLKQNGFNESAIGIEGGVPISTSYDIALFFEKLYKGDLANPDYTSKMLGLLKGQTLNNKIPKNLPNDVTIAHKTGEIDYFTHDGGIVFGKKGDYIIVVFSKSDYPPGAEEQISIISKAVYDYFENK